MKDKLIGEIKDKNSQVKEFLTNPFLVSLFYKSYTYNKDIPSKKITFYEEVYSCLFKHHDLSKEGFKRPKKSKLDIFDFEIILREIAFETSKIGRVIYSRDEMIGYVKNAKAKNPRMEFSEHNFFDDLTTTVPIFSMEGLKIKWAHKSIQDFFSAKYISNHVKKEEIISLILTSGKFHYLNILDLLYELEYKIFRKIVIKPILEKFISFYEGQFTDEPAVPRALIDEQIALLFGTRFCLLKTGFEIGFEQAREIFADAVNVDKDLFKSGVTFHDYDPSYYTMNELSLVKQIIRILRLKNEKLFIEPKSKNIGQYDDFINNFEFNIPYIFDDDLTKPYNDPKLFAAANSEIEFRIKEWNDSRKLIYSLDYKKCKETIDAIIKEEKLEIESDLFLNI